MKKIIFLGSLVLFGNLCADVQVRLQRCAALAKLLKNPQQQQPKRSVSPKNQAKQAKAAQPKNVRSVEIEHIPVLQQTAGAVCGYHALYNVSELMRLLSLIPSGQRCSVDINSFASLEQLAGYNNFAGRAADRIKQHREQNRSRNAFMPEGSEWLAGNEIEDLNDNPNILIMEENQSGFFDQEKLTKIHALLTGPVGSMLGFVWNFGHTGSVAEPGGVHWTGFVAVKCQNNIRLFAMDSASQGSVLYEENVARWLSHTPNEILAMMRRQQGEDRIVDALNNLFAEGRTRAATVDDLLFILKNIDREVILSEETKMLALQVFQIFWNMLTAERKNILKREMQAERPPNLSVQDILNRIQLI